MSTTELRIVLRRLPRLFGFAWWQFAIVPSFRLWWNQPMWRGIVHTTRLGPFWFAWMRRP